MAAATKARTSPKSGSGTEAKTDSKTIAGRMTGPRQIILDTIAANGGVIEDPDGQATVKLFEAMGRDDITIKALQNSLGKMQDRGLVVRDVRGKRTYAIALPGDLDARAAEMVEERGARDTPRDLTRDTQPAGPAESSDGIDYAQLATALLNRCAEILAAGDPSQMNDLLERLGEQTATTQTQARKLMDMAEDMVAVTRERDSLRERNRQLEANVAAVLKGDKAGNTTALRELERFISAKPTRRG